MVKGVSHEELAVLLGARSGTVTDPYTAHHMLELSRGPGPMPLPDCAMLGEAGNGWAFAIESPEVRDRDDRLATGRDLWSERTVVSVLDNSMDPPVIRVSVDGRHDGMFCEYTTNDTDHPLTRRLVADGGFVELSDRAHRDDASAGVTMPDVYRLMGEHYGLTLPRRAISDRRLPHAFTEPRVLVRPQAQCPVCGEERMLPYGGGAWGRASTGWFVCTARSATFLATRHTDAQERSGDPRWPGQCAKSRTRSTTTSGCRASCEHRRIT
ncbi:hypothetical protein [Streptomyces vilmorinianum]|uniref:hypothetical protein n=1 Tax=Streptomyces vilmorinianum TaxID=3051092 RepID=UPI0020C80C6C|nr:hypothetical protein [Streptomyces vilmorinianum]